MQVLPQSFDRIGYSRCAILLGRRYRLGRPLEVSVPPFEEIGLGIDADSQAVVVGGIACLAGCGERDVTKNPAYGFGVIAGTSWKTKVSIALSSIDRGYYGQICTDGYAASFDAGTANPREFDYNSPVKAVLPAGTVIRFDRLVAGGGDLGGYFVYSTVQSGKHVGKIVNCAKGAVSTQRFSRPRTFKR